MGAAPIIRPAQASDLEAINELLRQVLRVHHAGRPDLFRKEGKKFTDEELLALFSNPDTPVFVYEKDGVVLGHAFCVIRFQESGSLRPVKTLHLEDLCVHEEARGHHIGKQLFAYVKEVAKERGCHHIDLNVWACNRPARAFYESLGLTEQYTSLELILD